MESHLANRARGRRRADHHNRPGAKPLVREVGVEVHDHLPAVPVCPRHSTDENEIVHPSRPVASGPSTGSGRPELRRGPASAGRVPPALAFRLPFDFAQGIPSIVEG
jgi:hypothetical protein